MQNEFVPNLLNKNRQILLFELPVLFEKNKNKNRTKTFLACLSMFEHVNTQIIKIEKIKIENFNAHSSMIKFFAVEKFENFQKILHKKLYRFIGK